MPYRECAIPYFKGKRTRISVKRSSISAMEFSFFFLLTYDIFENVFENLVSDDGCRPGRRNKRNRNYCVYNPTTKQYTVLPPLPVSNGVFRAILGVNLAYDPSKSPDYKVICVRNSDSLREGNYQIEIYSSKTGPWRKSGGTFIAPADINFSLGVFWNGAIHWISNWGNNSLYFDADEEKLHEMSMPAVPAGCGALLCSMFMRWRETTPVGS
ncbi:hypothetical protein Ddye_013280 [Dipteronia dyeriana]|uniref:F-box associated beta-propeller type 3 domain-containing protein n=1 Tax=Dipteronia dyeriana TaxID=168575 RepID=A0AAE0CJG9_9ROSI|nr:hypothetical protein Ddye_013280 [Dipteronia dyeriana]